MVEFKDLAVRCILPRVYCWQQVRRRQLGLSRAIGVVGAKYLATVPNLGKRKTAMLRSLPLTAGLRISVVRRANGHTCRLYDRRLAQP